jgi:G3E family GTPase
MFDEPVHSGEMYDQRVGASQPQPSPIPLTVVGGYLGAGKTTLLNSLIGRTTGRRLGVVVNDFGALSIDADLLRGSVESDDGSLVSLPNGCVCCTLGHDLHRALHTMLTATPPLDQVVIEVSGVADPAVTAAWGTVPPFEPGGVVVLADVEQVRSRARDRYVGGEVRRQLAGADLLVVTKIDLVAEEELAATERWLEVTAPGIPRVHAQFGALPVELVLGRRPDEVRQADGTDDHGGDYLGWSWSSEAPVAADALQRFLDGLAPSVLRMKGTIVLAEGGAARVNVVGARREITRYATRIAPGGSSRLVAIGPRASLDIAALDASAATMPAW